MPTSSSAAHRWCRRASRSRTMTLGRGGAPTTSPQSASRCAAPPVAGGKTSSAACEKPQRSARARSSGPSRPGSRSGSSVAVSWSLTKSTAARRRDVSPDNAVIIAGGSSFRGSRAYAADVRRHGAYARGWSRVKGARGGDRRWLHADVVLGEPVLLAARGAQRGEAGARAGSCGTTIRRLVPDGPCSRPIIQWENSCARQMWVRHRAE